VKSTFAKTALVIGLFAGTAMEAHAVTGGGVVQIGCTVPSSNFAGATVYSVDAGGVAFASSNTAVAAGVNCTKAINNLTSGSSAAPNTATYALIANTNIVIPGTGYALQQFTLQDPISATPASVSFSLVGCTAPTPTGGTVYSVDSRRGYGSASLISSSTAIAYGANCASALNEISLPLAVQTEVGTAVGSNITYSLEPSTNLVVSNNGYSLQQFLIQ
jgi:hypothetical protein